MRKKGRKEGGGGKKRISTCRIVHIGSAQPMFLMTGLEAGRRRRETGHSLPLPPRLFQRRTIEGKENDNDNEQERIQLAKWFLQCFEYENRWSVNIDRKSKVYPSGSAGSQDRRHPFSVSAFFFFGKVSPRASSKVPNTCLICECPEKTNDKNTTGYAPIQSL